MSDREMLELAAKAAGIESGGGLFWCPATGNAWNPLTDDGDALRLAVKLNMCVGIAPHRVALDKTSLAIAPGGQEVSVKHNGDALAATRLAIARAAAEIGRNMK